MRWVLRVLAVLVAVPVLLYVGHGIARTVELGQARDRAETELAGGMPQARREADARVTGALGALSVGVPSRRWQELSCDLESIEAGWMVRSYEQRCVVRSVAVVPADADPSGCEQLDVPVSDDGPGWTLAYRGSAADLTSRDGWRRGCNVSVLTAAPRERTRLLSGARPGPVDGAEGWVVVRGEVDASTTDLGCNPWGLVFCTTPPGGVELDVPGT